MGRGDAFLDLAPGDYRVVDRIRGNVRKRRGARRGNGAHCNLETGKPYECAAKDADGNGKEAKDLHGARLKLDA